MIFLTLCFASQKSAGIRCYTSTPFTVPLFAVGIGPNTVLPQAEVGESWGALVCQDLLITVGNIFLELQFFRRQDCMV